MKRLILIIFLLLGCYTINAQDSKEQRKMIRQEKKHYRDSVQKAFRKSQWEKQLSHIEGKKRRYEDMILVECISNEPVSVIDTLVIILLNKGIVIDDINKDYHYIRTAQQSANFTNYDILFRAYKEEDKTLLQVTGRLFTHMHVAIGMVGASHQGAEKVCNRGMEDSAYQIAWQTMDTIAKCIPHSNITYIESERNE